MRVGELRSSSERPNRGRFGLVPKRSRKRSAGACRGDRRRACRLADVCENLPDRRCFGHEGDDLHLGAAVRAGEREDLEQAGDQRGPQVPCRGTRQRITAIGLVGFGRARRLHGGFLGERCDLGAQRRVGCKHAVIAMAMYAGRWHQCGNPVDQLQRGERDLDAPIGLRLGQMVAQMLVIDSLEAIEGKGRARAIT